MPTENKDFIQNGMDLDNEDRFVRGHRFALNVNIGTSDGNSKGAVENALGSRLISFTLPNGILKVVGTFSDRVNSSVIYMVFNSTGEHVLLRFHIQDLSIEELARGPILGFQEYVIISSIDLDKELLVWMDGVTNQKKINITKASVLNNLIVDFYFELLPPVSTDYTLTIPELSIVSVVHTVPGPNPATLEELTENVANGINALPLAGIEFTAIDAGTHVELSMLNAGYFTVFFTANTSEPIAVYNNMYQQPILASYIDLIKAPPRFPPVAIFVADGSFKNVNNIEQKVFEFRTRYLFDDGEISTLSPASKLPLNPTGYPFSEDNESYIEVNYLDEKLTSPAELNIITGVDIFMREENVGFWKKVKTILIDEIVGTNGKFIFLNNENYVVATTIEADKPSESMPIVSETGGFMDNLLFLDGKIESYDVVTTNVKITLDIEEEVIFSSTNDRGSFLKRPGYYKYGLVYYDRANRSTTVCKDPAMEINIPAYDADLSTISYVEVPVPPEPNQRYGVVSVNWEVRHLPPIWATHYSWVRTLDSIHNDYLVSTVNGGASYFEADKTTASPANTAVYVEINFDGWDTFNKFYSEGTQGWTFAKGDRMRILKDASDVWISEIPVTKIVSQINNNTFLVEVTDLMRSQPAISNNFLIEFFVLGNSVENETYHEIGEFFEINNPHTSTRSHKGEFQDQNPVDPIGTPAKGTFTNGDNYRIIGRDWGTPDTASSPNRIIDSPRADQRYEARMESYNSGRPALYAPNIGQANLTNTVRFSNKRFQGTAINGYSTFDDLNQADIPVKYGPIQMLSQIDNIMICICTMEAVSLYINENIYTDVSGNPTVAVSDQVIGDDRVLKGGFGTNNPESFTKHEGRGYWFSSSKGEYVRYGGDGLTSLSNMQASSFFKKKGELIKKHGGKIISTFDQFHDKVVVAISEIKDGENIIEPAVTMTFHEGDESSMLQKSWTAFWSYLPEHMAMVDTKIVAFKNGELWLHDNPVRCNYFGVQYTAQIEVVFNENPKMVKMFQNISIEGDDVWVPISITTPEGQQSSLILDDIKKKENIYYSEILRDENTPNLVNPITQGDVMRSAVLKVLLENSNTDKAVLYFVAVGFKPSYLNNI